MAGFSSAHWVGITELEKAFTRVGAQADVAARANVDAASAILIRDAQSNFEGAHKKGQPHVGGAKPNIVTGTLRRSIRGEGVKHYGMGMYTNTVGPTTKYGRRVELGMSGHGGAYPYFGPAAKQLRKEMVSIATANWAKHLKF